jgi:hypothetical protein
MTGTVKVEDISGTLKVEDLVGKAVTVVKVDAVIPGPRGPIGPYGRPRVRSVPYAPVIAVDWNDTDVVRVVLDGNAAFTFTGAYDGQKCMLVLTQGEVGSHTITLPANVRYGDSIQALVLSAAPGKQDKLGFIYDAVDDQYDFVAIAKGF